MRKWPIIYCACLLLIGTSELFAASQQAAVKNVQRASTTMAGATAIGALQRKDVAIAPVDTSKSYVNGSFRTTTSDPFRRVTFELFDSTTLRLSCYAPGADLALIEVEYEIVEFLSDVLVQRGLATLPVSGTVNDAAPQLFNVALGTAIATNKSFCLESERIDTGQRNRDENWTIRAQLTSGSNLELSRNEAGNIVEVAWQVITFTDLTTTSQKGLVSITAGNTFADVPIPAIDLTRSFLLVTRRASSASNGVENDYELWGQFTSTTNIRFTRGGTANEVDIAWVAVTLGPESLVESGQVTMANNELFANITLAALDVSKTITYVSVTARDPDNNPDVNRLDENSITSQLSSSTNLHFERETGGIPVNGSWFVVQFSFTSVYKETLDTDGDGYIDAIRMLAFEPINDNFAGFVLAVTGYTVLSYDTGTVPLDGEFFARLMEGPTPDTGATPLAQITSNTVTGTTSGFLLRLEPAAIAVVDKAKPVVVNVTSSTADGVYGAGAVIAVQVVYSEPVAVTGTPQLTLSTPTPDAIVNYSSGSGTNTLQFDYTVVSGQNTPDLDYVATTSLNLNGGTIQDLAMVALAPAPNTAVNTLPAPGGAGSLSFNKNIEIDTIVPTVLNVTSPNLNGIYGTGSIIDVTVQFSEPVVVTGTPQLTLETGAADAVVNYFSGSGTDTLTFRYTVAVGQNSSDLDYVDTTSLALNGGTITDYPNPAVLTLPAPAAAGSLGFNKDIIIHTPQIVARETVDSDGDGFLDAIRILTDIPLYDNFGGLDIAVAGYALAAIPYDTGATAFDNEFFVRLVELVLPPDTGDTGATPVVQVNSGGMLLIQVDGGVAASDKAKAVLLAAEWFDASGGGVSATDTIILTFSEIVSTLGASVAELGLPVIGDSLSTSIIADQGPSATIAVTLMGTPVLSPGGVYSAAMLLAGSPTGIYVMNGINIIDPPGNTALNQSVPTAVDLRPGAVVLAIAWDDLTTTPRIWTINPASLGGTYLAAPAFPPAGLIVRNVGNVRVNLNVSCTAASVPSGWTLAAAAATDQFEMKLVDGALVQDLSTGAKLLVSNLYSGHQKPFDLRFVSPTDVAEPALDVEQTITVTVVATQN